MRLDEARADDRVRGSVIDRVGKAFQPGLKVVQRPDRQAAAILDGDSRALRSAGIHSDDLPGDEYSDTVGLLLRRVHQ